MVKLYVWTDSYIGINHCSYYNYYDNLYKNHYTDAIRQFPPVLAMQVLCVGFLGVHVPRTPQSKPTNWNSAITAAILAKPIHVYHLFIT